MSWLFVYLHICVVGRACNKQRNGYYEWNSTPSNSYYPLSVTFTLLYISTHHHDRSVHLMLLSWHNRLVWTITILLFFSALLTHCVACLWKMVWSLRCQTVVTCGQLPGDSEPVIISTASLSYNTCPNTKSPPQSLLWTATPLQTNPSLAYLPPPSPLHHQGLCFAVMPFRLCFCVNETDKYLFCCSLEERW